MAGQRQRNRTHRVGLALVTVLCLACGGVGGVHVEGGDGAAAGGMEGFTPAPAAMLVSSAEHASLRAGTSPAYGRELTHNTGTTGTSASGSGEAPDDAEPICGNCPEEFYRTQPCVSAQAAPVCAQCDHECADGYEELQACAGSKNRVCRWMWPEIHRNCQKNSFELDLQQLMDATQEDCNNCEQYLPHINQALGEAFMSCPMRTAAFLAHVRHSTDGFTVFRKRIDEGIYVAGAIHMQVANWRAACKDIPALKDAIERELGTGCTEEDKCMCGSNGEASRIVARPEYAFRAGVWWFFVGAGLTFGEPCEDLRLDADEGLGGSLVYTTWESPGTGFQKTTTCIFGVGEDPGRQQRADYFETAKGVLPETVDFSNILSAASGRFTRAGVGGGACVAAAAAVAITVLGMALLRPAGIDDERGLA